MAWQNRIFYAIHANTFNMHIKLGKYFNGSFYVIPSTIIPKKSLPLQAIKPEELDTEIRQAFVETVSKRIIVTKVTRLALSD